MSGASSSWCRGGGRGRDPLQCCIAETMEGKDQVQGECVNCGSSSEYASLATQLRRESSSLQVGFENMPVCHSRPACSPSLW
eukprot:gene4951-3552_t